MIGFKSKIPSEASSYTTQKWAKLGGFELQLLTQYKMTMTHKKWLLGNLNKISTQ